MKFPLDQPFEATGKWWLPEKPERPIFGTLAYSTTGIDLSLHGTLTEYSANDIMAQPRVGERFSQVFGKTTGGQLFTLTNALVKSINLNLLPAVTNGKTALAATDGRTVVFANHLVAGGHTASFDEIRLRSIRLNCSCLAPFLACNPFDSKIPAENGDWVISYKQPEPVKFRIEPLATTLSFELSPEYKPSERSAELGWEAYAQITPDEPRSLKWFSETSWRLCDLLGLLVDERIRPLELRFGNDEEESFDGWLLYAAKEKYEQRKRLYPDELPFCFPNITPIFPSILDKWFSAEGTPAKSIHLFRAINRKDDASVERFLNATKCLEAFSRSQGQSKYLDAAGYKTIADTLRAAIPTSVPDDLRTSLNSRIRFGNEHSLRKRVVSLVRSLSLDGQAIVCKSAQDFADGLVKTRNYFTHYSDDPDTVPLAGIDLYWACEKLVMLMRLLLLKHVGLDEAVIIARIKSHHRLAQNKQAWEKCREIPSPRTT
jgi:hypothetical protein